MLKSHYWQGSVQEVPIALHVLTAADANIAATVDHVVFVKGELQIQLDTNNQLKGFTMNQRNIVNLNGKEIGIHHIRLKNPLTIRVHLKIVLLTMMLIISLRQRRMIT